MVWLGAPHRAENIEDGESLLLDARLSSEQHFPKASCFEALSFCGIGSSRQAKVVVKTRHSHLPRRFGFLVAGAAIVAAAVSLSPRSLRRGTFGAASPTASLPLEPTGADEVIRLDSFPQPPSLLCFTVMRAGGAEEALVMGQLKRRASLFACDSAVVFSSAKTLLGTDQDGSKVYTWGIPVPVASTTEEVMNGQVKTSFINAETFIIAWDALLAQGGLIWSHEWTVKVDPDTVFFPDRLLLHLCAFKDRSIYFQNCQPKESKYPVLFGSLEIYSLNAIKNYASNKERCKQTFDWRGSPESTFMQQCMDLLGVAHTYDSSLLGDSRCSPAVCSDWTRVSFHPFKDVKSYFECFEEATIDSL